jgi:hypothetical protein
MTRPRGKPFTDDHRVVLMIIRQLPDELSWEVAAEVFNLVFRNARNENPRTMKMLQQYMSLRKKDQKAKWDIAWADVNMRNRWAPAIDAALRDLRSNPNRAPITAESEPTLRWDFETRLASHLLMTDRDLPWRGMTRIFNSIFKRYIAR